MGFRAIQAKKSIQMQAELQEEESTKFSMEINPTVASLHTHHDS